MADDELADLGGRFGVGRLPRGRGRRRLCDAGTRRRLDGPHRAGDTAGERRRHHDRHRRARRHLRLHAAAHRRRHGVRGAGHGAEHPDPAAGRRRSGPSSPSRRAWRSWPPRRGTSSRADRPTIAPTTDSRPVGELVDGDVLVVAPDASVRDAVCRMTEHHVSYALIRLPDGEFGIFTDRDLRTRVVAAGVSIDAPITQVMSAPARRVTADLTAETVLMDMLECGLRHMPVVTSRGEVVGVRRRRRPAGRFGQAEFHPAALHRIGRRRSANCSGRAAGHRRGRRPVPQRHEGVGHQRDPVGRHRQPGAQGARIGARRSRCCDVAGFAWLTLGSVARREAMPSSDVDSALSWRDDMSSASGQLRAIAVRTHEILDGCGLPSDRNGAVAYRAALLALAVGVVRRGARAGSTIRCAARV